MVYSCNIQLDNSSCDLPAKDTVRYAEDQITMETNKEHSMNTGEQLIAVTVDLALFSYGESITH